MPSTPSTCSAAALPLTLLLACACFCRPALAASPGDLPASIARDNWVTLLYGQGVTELNFDFQQARVSEGEALGEVSMNRSTDRLEVLVVAPRRATRDVAQDLMLQINGEPWRMLGTAFRTAEPNPAPKELNFWIGGGLWINGVEVPGGLYLAQGRVGGRNNWWAANAYAEHRQNGRGSGLLRITDAQQRAYCLRGIDEFLANRYEIADCDDQPAG